MFCKLRSYRDVRDLEADLVREGTVAGGDTNHGNVVEASRVGDAGRRELALLGFADDYCVHLGQERMEPGLQSKLSYTCSLISLLHTTIAVLIGFESIIWVESYKLTFLGRYIFL